MRPINLIPEDDRRGPGATTKGAPLAYIVIGALVVLLAGVAMLVSTNNEISSSEAEIVELKAESAAAETKASKLTAYTQLRDVHDERVATVTSLAESRFDWERVMRELALILPSDVWLTSLTGTAGPQISVSGGAGVSLRTGTSGPALEMEGCADGQEAVAGFVTALRDIDGVTRVAMQFSKLGEGSEGAGGGEVPASGEAASTSSGGTCPIDATIAQFQIVAAFDAAPVTAAAPTEAPVAAAPAPEGE